MSASERVTPTVGAGTPLRVGFVALGGLGGSGRVACDVARSMAARGHATFALTSARAPWRLQLGPDVPHVVVDTPAEPSSPDQVAIDTLADQIAAAVQAHDLPVLSVHYGRGLAAAAVGARRRLGGTGPSICVTLHGSDVTALATEPRQAAALAEALAACDEVTAVSSWLADAAVRILKLPRRPRVIHNGVDLELFHPAAREPSAEARLFHASNFRVIKRPHDAVAVLADLRARGVAARLTMAGDGPLRAEAIALARRLGLSDHVDFPGALAPERLAERLRACDIALVTSVSESFGLVALEAMASGVPIVGTRCGGLEEILGSDPDLPELLLAPASDVQGLATRVARILGDPEHASDLAQRGLAIAHRRFERDAQVDAYVQMLGRARMEPA